MITEDGDRQRILNACHSDPTSGHLGVKKTIKRIRERFTWKGLNKDVANLVNHLFKTGNLVEWFNILSCPHVMFVSVAMIKWSLSVMSYTLFLYIQRGIMWLLISLVLCLIHDQETGLYFVTS